MPIIRTALSTFPADMRARGVGDHTTVKPQRDTDRDEAGLAGAPRCATAAFVSLITYNTSR